MVWDAADEEHYVGLDIYTAEKDRFEGMYSMDDDEQGPDLQCDRYAGDCKQMISDLDKELIVNQHFIG